MKLRIALVSTVCLAVFASTAHASSIVFNGGGPDQVNAYFADADYAWTAATNDIFSFPLGPVTLTGANWWGACVTTSGTQRSVGDLGSFTPAACSANPSFVLTLYDTSSGTTPADFPIAFSTVVSPVQTATGQFIDTTVPEYEYTASFCPIALPAGNYLFGLSANMPGVTWGWETAASGEANHYQLNVSDTSDPFFFPLGWDTPSHVLAFDLLGPDATAGEVPEPATLSLLAIGLAGAALRRRR